MVNEQNLEDLELFLSQSLRGVHHLFDHETIKDVLKKSTEDEDFFSLKNMERIQSLIVKMMEQPSLDAKREYLKKLDPENYEMVLRAYFHIVENTLISGTVTRH